MVKTLLALVVFPFVAANAIACLNSYDEEIMGRMSRGNPEEIARELALAEAEYRKNPSLEVSNDLAVAHVLSGHYQKAVDLLQNLENEHPGYSKTASNLGTAYELVGKNELALVWIKEGIKRDAADHEGTEWLHVKILEAKLAMESDPDWLANHSVLGTNFDRDGWPSSASELKDHLGRKLTFQEAAKALEYQLHERLKFVSIPDPLIGDLYFSWANIEALPKDYDPRDLFDAALKFGARNEALVKSRAAHYSAAHPLPDIDRALYIAPWIVGSVGVIVVAFGAIIYFRRRRTARSLS